MIRQLINFKDTKFLLACSGGVDSMAIADFYKKGKKNFSIAYFNHGTSQADIMQDFTESWAKKNNISYLAGKISRLKNKDESPEEYWRNERYSWLKSFNLPIITCHHLDDVLETYLFSCMHGNPKLISTNNGLVYRPFLLNKKSEFINWCLNNQVSWLEDNSNKDVNFPRNRIRHNIVPEAIKINPGIYKVIKKKILSSIKNEKIKH